MKTAVCLLTADRAALTQLTLATFLRHNEPGAFVLLHGDDASTDGADDIARQAGFTTVYGRLLSQRRGQIPALRALWAEAAARGCDYILHLENDIEFARPVPARRDAEQIRLYGEYKARPGSPRDRASDRIWGTDEKAVWRPDGDGWERGVIHWGAQPSLTRTDLLLRAVSVVERVHDIPAALRRLDTLRPKQNITWHADPGGTTPGHWLGKDKRINAA